MLTRLARLAPPSRTALAGALALVTLAALGGCKDRADRLADAELPPRRSARDLLADAERALYAPDRAEMKGDLEVDSPDMSIKLDATIRLRADSALWLTVRKFGFEGGRALVTPSELVLVNRLQREYLRATPDDLPDGAAKLPVDPTLANLQAVFMGRAVGEWRGASVERAAGRWILTDEDRYRGASLELGARPRTAPVRWSYRDGERFGTVAFSDFREVAGGRVFPYARAMTYSDRPGDTTRVTLRLKSITEPDALRFPISVPDSYSDMSR